MGIVEGSIVTKDAAYKYVEDNLAVEFEATLSRASLAELYESIYEIKPRSSYRKADIATQLRYYVLQMHRTEALSRGLR